MHNPDFGRGIAAGHADRLQEPSLDDCVPGPRERYWRLFVWIATMVLLGAALSLISTP